MTEPPRERLDCFMARANAAYYATHDPFADFTTAPEISQAFGEVLGLWAAMAWRQMGSPSPVLLAEAGPGRGTLMADALHAIRRAMPDFAAALRVHFVETSPRLRAIQAQRVAGAAFTDTIGALPAGPLILLGNEFLDALPIRRFVRRGGIWLEQYVASDGARSRQWVEDAAKPPMPALPGDAPEAATVSEGTFKEWSEAAHEIIAGLAERLAHHPGAALFLDYGPETSGFGESLQALMNGEPADPIGTPPGQADLTAHVDFAALLAAAARGGAAGYGPVPQGRFLLSLGLMQRCQRLAAGQAAAQARAIMNSAQRLTQAEYMGSLFKAIALTSPGMPAPAGFEAAAVWEPAR